MPVHALERAPAAKWIEKLTSIRGPSPTNGTEPFEVLTVTRL